MDLRFQCVRCGKLTGGRRPRDGIGPGDGSYYWPRRHKSDLGDPCPGIYDEAEWVEREVGRVEPLERSQSRLRGKLDFKRHKV
ncbi:hypothetical protein CcrColossus_gp360 [Caulobacter phage CcrColossus]|uniref:Uncharacterized protein n=1 Tax=Caulobacter phage CcrColossus TaxID=1211640 RepID=K4JV40_9CAUD|nr:hypothetical protein CcrColossus_gp360 [Caulobacter phage CcrColossus]AFU88230.1 hypothetical protein CcrColossus_gp360 [Caulobacter phage CcrColossus]